MKDLKEWLHDAKHGLEQEREEMRERADQLEYRLNALDVTSKLLAEADTLREENESLREQLQEEKRLRAEMEMKMAEMSKLSADMAKKSSEEDLLKALRTYANRSKRKTADKRTFAKSAILEIANVNNLTLPEDLATTVESLDDEQAEPKTTTNHYIHLSGDGATYNENPQE